MYKIILPINFDGERYGLKFIKGIAFTDDILIANKLSKKFSVEKQEPDIKSNIENNIVIQARTNSKTKKDVVFFDGKSDEITEAEDVIASNEDNQ